MKKLLVTLLLFVLTLTAAYSITKVYDHMHLNGKWYAYAYHKADGTYYKFEEGLLFLEFFDIHKVKLSILGDKEADIMFSERKLISGFYYTHIKLKDANESWLIKENTPNEDFAIIEILKGNFPLKYQVDYKVLISKKENYFANLKEPKELLEEPKKSEEPKEPKELEKK